MKKAIVRRSIHNHLISDAPEIHPVLQRVYAARGIQSKNDLERDLNRLLPFETLLGIDQAAIYLADAIQAQKSILIIGDFDADGATSSALAVAALRAFGAEKIDYLIPNRFEYGYGLTPEIVAVAAKKNPHIIVTVDNGISSQAGVAAANALGIKVIITDHHLPGHDLPAATAIVNPQQHGDSFASKNLAGVGVIFYVMLAVRNELRLRNWFTEQNPLPNMGQFLDLVALGTVADLVPLDCNNRILVQQGLQRIRHGKARPGIQALLAVAGRLPQRITASDLGFAVAPRLNAAGRLADMSLGIECLLSQDLNHARELATQLSVLNEERRLIEGDMKQQAFVALNKLKLTADNLSAAICLFDESWHQGVIGLLASRVKEHYHRPAIIFAPGNNDQELKGSARSIEGLHIRDLLDRIATNYPDLIIKFGGHAMAAGLSIRRANLGVFSEIFKTTAQQVLDPEKLEGKLMSDGELTDFSVDLAKQIREAGPWGQAFPEPIFDGAFKILNQRLVGTKHLKLTLTPSNSNQQLEAIAFNIDLKSWPNYQANHIHAAYRLDINEYLGRVTLQLIVEQLEVVG